LPAKIKNKPDINVNIPGTLNGFITPLFGSGITADALKK
jgi:hypothetical protein